MTNHQHAELVRKTDAVVDTLLTLGDDCLELVGLAMRADKKIDIEQLKDAQKKLAGAFEDLREFSRFLRED